MTHGPSPHKDRQLMGVLYLLVGLAVALKGLHDHLSFGPLALASAWQAGRAAKRWQGQAHPAALKGRADLTLGVVVVLAALMAGAFLPLLAAHPLAAHPFAVGRFVLTTCLALGFAAGLLSAEVDQDGKLRTTLRRAFTPHRHALPPANTRKAGGHP